MWGYVLLDYVCFEECMTFRVMYFIIIIILIIVILKSVNIFTRRTGQTGVILESSKSGESESTFNLHTFICKCT